MGPPSSVSETVDLFERGLIGGRARWVADLTEFFRGHRIGNTVFELYARGKTRNRGLLLSRFFAWSVLPNYTVSLLCIDGGGRESLTSERLRAIIEDVTHQISRDDLQWCWLIILSSGELPSWAVSFVSRYDRRELGIGLASITSGQVVLSSSQIGQSIGKHLGLYRLMEGVAHGKAG